MEEQKEKIRVCGECGGALRIATSSDRNPDVLAVHIPQNACHACKETGYQWFDEKASEDFDLV